MDTKIIISSFTLLSLLLFTACQGRVKQELDIPDQVAILEFRVDSLRAEIDNDTIRLVLPRGTDLTAITPQISITPGAIVTPASGETVNFLHQPVNYRVTLGNIYQDYCVSVTTDDIQTPRKHGRRIGYINWEDTENTGGQEYAWQWLQTVYPDSCDLLSLWDIQHGTVDMDAYAVVWYYTRGVGGDGTLPFRAYDRELVEQMKAYTNSGGKLLLTGLAPRWLQTLGLIDDNSIPNNFYGHETVTLNQPGGITPIALPQIFSNMSPAAEETLYLMGTNCTFENNTSAWFLASWGGYNNSINTWQQATGGIALATDLVDNATVTRVVMAEFPVTSKRASHVITINTGLYDWSAHNANSYQTNIEQLTRNAIDYLRK